MRLGVIVYPTDFSVLSEATLEVAVAVARETGGRLLITHVKHDVLPNRLEPGPIGVPQDVDELPLARMLEEIRPSDPQVPFEHRLLSGDPAEQILQLAARERADLIVMSTHGRTGLSRALLGSVAEVVVRRASCPVLTVKQPWPSAAKERNDATS